MCLGSFEMDVMNFQYLNIYSTSFLDKFVNNKYVKNTACVRLQQNVLIERTYKYWIHIYVDPNNVKLIFPLSQYLIIFLLHNVHICCLSSDKNRKKHAVILAWSPCSCINWLLFLALNSHLSSHFHARNEQLVVGNNMMLS